MPGRIPGRDARPEGAARAACTLLAAVLAVSAPAAAQDFGRSDRWVRGTAQGACDAIVTDGGSGHIYVTCGCDGLPSGVLFTIDGKTAGTGEIELGFDDRAPQAVPVESGTLWADCATCSPGFGEVIQSLRRFNRVSVRFASGAAADFTLRGSSAAIGACIAPRTDPAETDGPAAPPQKPATR